MHYVRCVIPDKSAQTDARRGVTASGVPFVALPPADGQTARAMIILWHGGDPPRTEEALAGALPLRGLAAWRVYLGLPLCGQRMPEGGFEEIMRRGAEDAVALLYHPIIAGAADELPAAVAELQARLGVAPELPLGLFGFSMGGAAALLAASRRVLPVRAAMTWGAPPDMGAIVDAVAPQFGLTYEWTPARRQLAAAINAVDHVQELADSGTALLLAVGGDDAYPVLGHTLQLAAALRAAGATVDTDVLPGLGHAFADEPGMEAAPQGPDAQLIEQLATRWFSRAFA